MGRNSSYLFIIQRIDYLREAEFFTTKEYMRKFDVSLSTVHRDYELMTLIGYEKKLVSRAGYIYKFEKVKI